MSDKVLEELWRIKDDMAREYGYDVPRLAAALRAAQGGGGTPSRRLARLAHGSGTRSIGSPSPPARRRSCFVKLWNYNG